TCHLDPVYSSSDPVPYSCNLHPVDITPNQVEESTELCLLDPVSISAEHVQRIVVSHVRTHLAVRSHVRNERCLECAFECIVNVPYVYVVDPSLLSLPKPLQFLINTIGENSEPFLIHPNGNVQEPLIIRNSNHRVSVVFAIDGQDYFRRWTVDLDFKVT